MDKDLEKAVLKLVRNLATMVSKVSEIIEQWQEEDKHIPTK